MKADTIIVMGNLSCVSCRHHKANAAASDSKNKRPKLPPTQGSSPPAQHSPQQNAVGSVKPPSPPRPPPPKPKRCTDVAAVTVANGADAAPSENVVAPPLTVTPSPADGLSPELESVQHQQPDEDAITPTEEETVECCCRTEAVGYVDATVDQPVVISVAEETSLPVETTSAPQLVPSSQPDESLTSTADVVPVLDDETSATADERRLLDWYWDTVCRRRSDPTVAPPFSSQETPDIEAIAAAIVQLTLFVASQVICPAIERHLVTENCDDEVR